MAQRLILILSFFYSAAMAQTEVYIPQFAHGGGFTNISTTVTIVNQDDGILNPARVTVQAFDADGNPADLLLQSAITGDTAVSEVQVEIPGRGTALVESFSNDPGQLSLGYVKVSSETAVSVEVIFKIFAGMALQTTTSILPSDPTDAATLLVNVDSSENIVSSVAVVNSPDAGETATISATIYDQFGQEVGSGSFDLDPGQRVAANWAELVPALEGLVGFVGTAEVTVNVPVAMLPLRQDNIELTTQGILPAR
ncbi:MAG TPA: hypothetical protein VLU25_12930 [Acidobacteriota bacterium]|nr:hypothetical protein [Acidobacteriota bacterium]